MFSELVTYHAKFVGHKENVNCMKTTIRIVYIVLFLACFQLKHAFAYSPAYQFVERYLSALYDVYLGEKEFDEALPNVESTEEKVKFFEKVFRSNNRMEDARNSVEPFLKSDDSLIQIFAVGMTNSINKYIAANNEALKLFDTEASLIDEWKGAAMAAKVRVDRKDALNDIQSNVFNLKLVILTKPEIEKSNVPEKVRISESERLLLIQRIDETFGENFKKYRNETEDRNKEKYKHFWLLFSLNQFYTDLSILNIK